LETKNDAGEMELPVIERVFGMALAILRRVKVSAETNGESEHERPKRTHIKPPAPFQGQTSDLSTTFPDTRARINP
jgi:hypothetical protein